METFVISIEHHGVLKTFQGIFGKYGWSYRFIIDVEGSEVIFEPDEERNLRTIVPPALQDNAHLKELVRLIGEELGRQLSS